MARERLDILLVKKGLASSRTLAQALVMEGRVQVEGRRVDKAGALVDVGADLHVEGPARPYSSRGGLKLEAALEAFGIDAAGLTVLDIGAGTGGFTDCLLKREAARVFAVDVGRGQIDHRLRLDPRVTVIEKLNARFMEPSDLPGKADLAVMDVSFISATLIFPRIPPVLIGRQVVVLVKPQFEVGRSEVGKGGIVRNREGWRRAILSVVEGARALGWRVAGLTPSPVPGSSGNREFFLLLELPPSDSASASMVHPPDVEEMIDAALDDLAGSPSRAGGERT
jgi:23S rRNA (cytidine1920-2'-O)/16S rRNA (cytidine1409-2'-O)-methyltransferase